MLNPNIARRLVIASATAIACLGSSACSGREAAPVAPATALASPDINTTDGQPTVETTYYPNGTRMVDIFNSGNGHTLLLSYCDNKDLLDVILEHISGGAGAGGSVSRTPNAPACADGRLDPSDFTPSK